jgi:hypothetical protein
MLLPPSEPHRPDDPDRNGHTHPPADRPRPASWLSPPPNVPADLPPIRRLLTILYLVTVLCVILAAGLWWRILQ